MDIKSLRDGKYAALIYQVLFIVFLVVLLFVAFHFFDAKSRLENFVTWMDGLGPWSSALFILFYIIFPIVFLPVAVLTIGAGILFGFTKGFLLVTLAATLSSVVSFMIGRYLLRDWVKKQCRKNDKLAAVEKVLVKDGWKIVAMSRLSPVTPFWLLNYFYGSTKVPLAVFTWATFLALLPKNAVFVGIGSAGGGFSASGESSTAKIALSLVGIAVTFILSYYLTVRAKKALEGRLKA